LLPLSRTPSLTEQVASRLREALVQQQLAPGTLVVIDHLASLLAVSRTPVREALPALLQLGLIQETPTGLRVAPLDASYARQVYAVRTALESLVVQVVTPLLTTDDLELLREITYPAHPGVENDYDPARASRTSRFHDFIRAHCPLGFINTMLETVQVHIRRLDEMQAQALGIYRTASMPDHQAIFDAMQQRDAHLAQTLMWRHLDRIGEEIASFAADPNAHRSKSG
jgi:DNA-binding GntR family transcriptional regulator